MMVCIVDDWLAIVRGYVGYVISYSTWFIQDYIMTHEPVSSLESTSSGFDWQFQYVCLLLYPI